MLEMRPVLAIACVVLGHLSAQAQFDNLAFVASLSEAEAAAASVNYFVTNTTMGTSRSDFTGFTGYFVTVGGSQVSITGLGRWIITGNGQSHTLYLLELPAVTVVASVVVNASGAPPGAYLYGSTNVTLAASTTYALVSSETNGGDQFGDTDTLITVDTSRGLTVGSPCYSAYITDTPSATSSAGHAFGPLNIRFN